jgi:hypothetical protein
MALHSSNAIHMSFTKCLMKKYVSKSLFKILGAKLIYPQLIAPPAFKTSTVVSKSSHAFSAYSKLSVIPIVFPAIAIWLAILVS